MLKEDRLTHASVYMEANKMVARPKDKRKRRERKKARKKLHNGLIRPKG